MANGWARLGEALAGVTPAKRADIEARTMGQLAQRDRSVAQARDAMAKSEALASLGSYFADIGIENPEAAAGIGRSGINLNTLTSGMGKVQEQRFRQAARDAAVEGDHGRANNELWGVASGPVEIPKVSGNMLLSNRLIPGGGDVTVTPIGQSMIRANDARAQASIINANKPRASGGGSSGAAPKLSEIDKLRLQSELKALEPQLQAALDEVARNQGATVGPGVRKLAEAQARVAEIQAAQQAIFNKYEGGMAVKAPAPRLSEMYGVEIPAGSNADEMSALIAMNQEFDRTGQPRLTGDEVRAYRETGAVRRPAAADPVTVAEGAINPRLFDQFQQSLTGGTPAPDPRGGLARPTSKAERDRLPPGTRYIAPDGSERIKR